MPRMSEQRRRYIKDAIKAGYTSEKITDMFGTSIGTIVNLKREMGIPIRQQSKETKFTVPEVATAGIVEVARAMEATVMHHRDIPHVYGVEPVPQDDSTDTTMYDLFGDEVQPDTPQTYTPQEYFEAIANGLRQRDVENNVLRQERDRLQAENQKLLSDLSQCKLQMANWTGPSALPGRSLGNGG
jgi:hypothetical protein